MKYIALLFCVCLYSCLPNTNGKEPQVDKAIDTVNETINKGIDKAQKVKIKIYYADTSIVTE